MCIKSDRCQIGCGEVSQAVCSALNTAAQRQLQKIITSLEVKCHFHMLTALLIFLFICMSRNSLLFIATRPYDGRNHLRIVAEARDTYLYFPKRTNHLENQPKFLFSECQGSFWEANKLMCEVNHSSSSSSSGIKNDWS